MSGRDSRGDRAGERDGRVQSSERRRPLLAVALDVPGAEEARELAGALEGHADVLKVGLQLFIAAGPGLVRDLVESGWSVFLDLKVHDIPATAAGAVASAAGLGVDYLTIHASGGEEMIRRAAEARDARGGRPRLLGVSLLTSLDQQDLDDQGIPGSPGERVERLCRLAREGGCDGVVASAREASGIKEAHGREFLVVTPGIRPAGAGADDQARVTTPAEAARAGADCLVVGRPIRLAADPAAAADDILRQMIHNR